MTGIEWVGRDVVAEREDREGAEAVGCHVETFYDRDGYGWQCFTCPAEDREYAALDQAEQAGARHADDAHP